MITGKITMAVTGSRRNHLSRYSGYMTSPAGLVLLDTCGDPADLVVAFLNTLDVDEGTDALASTPGWATWLSAQGLRASFGEPERRRAGAGPAAAQRPACPRRG